MTPDCRFDMTARSGCPLFDTTEPQANNLYQTPYSRLKRSSDLPDSLFDMMKDFRFEMTAQNFRPGTVYNLDKNSYNITVIFISLSIDIFADV